MPFIVEGVDLDLRMRGFEFFSLVSSYPYPFDSPRPMHLKASGRIRFQGKVLKSSDEQDLGCMKTSLHVPTADDRKMHGIAGDVSISGLKLNQLMLAPQLVGQLNVSHAGIRVFPFSTMLQCLP